MRIAHVIPTYVPATRYGGPVQAVHDLCKHLIARGHETHVFTTNVDGPGIVEATSPDVQDVDGVMVQYFPVRSPRRLYYSPEMAIALERRITEFDILHLHSTYLYPTLKAARYAETTRVPYVLSPRGMLVKSLIKKRNFLAKSVWISLFERRTVEHASGVHVTSALEAEELRKFGFCLPPVHTIPNGIIFPTADNQTPRDADSILFLGRINWKKGIEKLICALPLLDSAQLIVAGNDESGHTTKLLKLCTKLGVDNRVRFVGSMVGHDKWQLYRRASVFVLPSLSENLANTVLEAMAMRCPVVVTPEVGLADAVERHGTGLVCEDEPSALANAISYILKNTDAALSMGEKGRRLVEHSYGWGDIAAAMERVYAQIVGVDERRQIA